MYTRKYAIYNPITCIPRTFRLPLQVYVTFSVLKPVKRKKYLFFHASLCVFFTNYHSIKQYSNYRRSLKSTKKMLIFNIIRGPRLPYSSERTPLEISIQLTPRYLYSQSIFRNWKTLRRPPKACGPRPCRFIAS